MQQKSHCLSMYRYAVIQATVSKRPIRDTVWQVSIASLLPGEPKVPIQPVMREEPASTLKVFTCCADDVCTNITIGSTAALTEPFTQQSLQHNAVYQQAQCSLTMMCGQLSPRLCAKMVMKRLPHGQMSLVCASFKASSPICK